MSAPRRFSTVALAVTVLAGAGAGAALAPCAAAAQDVAPASFTAAQADSGRVTYEQICAACHGPEFEGDEGPSLSGAYFRSMWGGKEAGQLVRFVHSYMPMSNPGTLEERTAAAAVAYVLSVNGMTAGTAPLTRETTGVIVIPPTLSFRD